jgi:hypothetical protein
MVGFCDFIFGWHCPDLKKNKNFDFYLFSGIWKLPHSGLRNGQIPPSSLVTYQKTPKRIN